jgi:hypothetical protein
MNSIIPKKEKETKNSNSAHKKKQKNAKYKVIYVAKINTQTENEKLLEKI